MVISGTILQLVWGSHSRSSSSGLKLLCLIVSVVCKAVFVGVFEGKSICFCRSGTLTTRDFAFVSRLRTLTDNSPKSHFNPTEERSLCLTFVRHICTLSSVHDTIGVQFGKYKTLGSNTQDCYVKQLHFGLSFLTTGRTPKWHSADAGNFENTTPIARVRINSDTKKPFTDKLLWRESKISLRKLIEKCVKVYRKIIRDYCYDHCSQVILPVLNRMGYSAL